MKNHRLHYLDVSRGIAIILMVVYHLCFDLDYFHYIQIDMNSDPYWRIFRYSIVTLFLVTMGMSLALTHELGICWRRMKKRTLVLGGAAIGVSIASYLLFPNSWIYFGILHFILLASWLGLFFIGKSWLALATAIIILMGVWFNWLHTHMLFTLLQQSLHLPSKSTKDIVPVFPWFAVVLIGIFIVAKQWHRSPQLKITKISKQVAFLGQHSLLVYMIHQPLLFGLIFFYQSLTI